MVSTLRLNELAETYELKERFELAIPNLFPSTLYVGLLQYICKRRPNVTSILCGSFTTFEFFEFRMQFNLEQWRVNLPRV